MRLIHTNDLMNPDLQTTLQETAEQYAVHVQSIQAALHPRTKWAQPSNILGVAFRGQDKSGHFRMDVSCFPLAGNCFPLAVSSLERHTSYCTLLARTFLRAICASMMCWVQLSQGQCCYD